MAPNNCGTDNSGYQTMPENMKGWYGGYETPSDWDGGMVWLRIGLLALPPKPEDYAWRHARRGSWNSMFDIIGYSFLPGPAWSRRTKKFKASTVDFQPARKFLADILDKELEVGKANHIRDKLPGDTMIAGTTAVYAMAKFAEAKHAEIIEQCAQVAVDALNRLQKPGIGPAQEAVLLAIRAIAKPTQEI